MHEDLRKSARCRAVFDALVEGLDCSSGLLQGLVSEDILASDWPRRGAVTRRPTTLGAAPPEEEVAID
jgi:hypothetical protein